MLFTTDFFKDNYNYHFDRPHTDVCSKCEELSVRLKNTILNERAKMATLSELNIHKKHAKKFHAKMKEVEV